MAEDAEHFLLDAWADAEAWFVVMDDGDEGYIVSGREVEWRQMGGAEHGGKP